MAQSQRQIRIGQYVLEETDGAVAIRRPRFGETIHIVDEEFEDVIATAKELSE
jgi:hypothetical protein